MKNVKRRIGSIGIMVCILINSYIPFANAESLQVSFTEDSAEQQDVSSNILDDGNAETFTEEDTAASPDIPT